MPQNLIEKVAQQFALNLDSGQELQSGDYVSISPAHILTHDNSGAVINKFQGLGAERMDNSRQPVFVLDHNIQDQGKANQEKYGSIERFAQKMDVDFYPPGTGIGHQIMCEEGYAWPGTMVVASDSHANMYGALGVLGTPVVRTDAAAIWATGRSWWQVPPVTRILLNGTLRPGVSGKDVIITLAGLFSHDEVLNDALEFGGEGLNSLSMDQRFTIANMSTEWGALAAVFPIDAITYTWLENQAVRLEKRGLIGVASDSASTDGVSPRMKFDRIAKLKHEAPYADPDAFYSREIIFDLSTVEPMISGPDHVKMTKSASTLEQDNIQIDKAYLLSCVNSRVEDLAEAARVIRGKTFASHVQFYLSAASSAVQSESEARGDWQALVEAGAQVLPPGCGPCIGLGEGLLEDGEVGISATNRNFKGRMGSADAKVYLASPAVVAASAVQGKIASPFEFSEKAVDAQFTEYQKTVSRADSVELIDGFPSEIGGNILFCHQDNLNTDGIFPGKYTYLDDFTPEDQARVAMENYDPEFASLVSDGDILVGGFNFGTGSSREQAATALKYKGISLLLAGSFSETYKRNALNNGILTLETPDLVNDLLKEYGQDKLTVSTQKPVAISFSRAQLEYDGKLYKLNPVGKAAQELIVSGGLENWVKVRLQQTGNLKDKS